MSKEIFFQPVEATSQHFRNTMAAALVRMAVQIKSGATHVGGLICDGPYHLRGDIKLNPVATPELGQSILFLLASIDDTNLALRRLRRFGHGPNLRPGDKREEKGLQANIAAASFLLEMLGVKR